jgi:DNA-binding Xre family transcriptional regulator
VLCGRAGLRAPINSLEPLDAISDAAAMSSFRSDRGLLSKPSRTPQGFLQADAFFTRTGVFEYRNLDGTVRRELRLPEEVFRPDSLATFRSATVTMGHPREPVTPRNARTHGVGYTKDDVRRDGDKMRGTIIIDDEKAIAEMKAGRREISNGYFCDLEMTAGVTAGIDGVEDGLTYDCIQRNIIGNHVAIVDRGRAGPEVVARVDSMRVDSVDDVAWSTMRYDDIDQGWRLDNPYEIRESGSEYQVIKSEGGRVMGTHESREMALRQLAALEAAERDDELDYIKVDQDSFKPTSSMANNAKRALEVRAKKPPSQRGMIATGLARARDIANRRPLSIDTVVEMSAWFARHEVDKKGKTWDEQGKGWQAWHGWGGDSGKRWADAIVKRERGDGGYMHPVGQFVWPIAMDRGLTVTELAQALGVQENGVEPLLAGEVMPTGKQLEGLAELLDVSAEQLKDLLPDRQRKNTDREDKNMKRKITIDGITFEFEADDTAYSAIVKAVDGGATKLDEAIAAAAKADAEHEAALSAEKARADSAEERATKAEAERDTALDPSTMRKRIDERLALERTAQEVLGEKFDSKMDDGDLRRAVIVAVQPSANLDGKDEVYVAARFDAALDLHKASKADQLPGHAQTRYAAHHTTRGDGHVGSSGSSTVEKARQDMMERNRNMWKTPLSATKDADPEAVRIRQ